MSSSDERGRPRSCEVNTFAGLALQNYWELLSEPLEDEERELESKQTVLLRSQRTTLQLSFNQ